MSGKNIVESCFLSSRPCLAAHVHAIKQTNCEYMQTVKFLSENGTFAALSATVKAHVFAGLHICRQHGTLESMLNQYDAPEIFKALSLLDRPRRKAQLLKKIQKIEHQNPELILLRNCERTQDTPKTVKRSKVDLAKEERPKRNCRKIDLYRRQASLIERDLKDDCDRCTDTAVAEMIESSSVSGALARKVRKWARQLPPDRLEFVMLVMPTMVWKQLADIVHFEKQDFAVPYFLSALYSEASIPEDSFVAAMRELQNAPQQELATKFKKITERHPQIFLSYNLLRTHHRLFEEAEIVELLSERIPLDTHIWYFEELYKGSRRCDEIIDRRITEEAASDGTLSPSGSAQSKVFYSGKILERIITLKRMGLKFAKKLIPTADSQLRKLQETWRQSTNNASVAVFGDASSSMYCAILSATIFASMVSGCFGGELSFFNHDLVKSPHTRPRTVDETLKVCSTIRASGATSLAAALWPYYKDKRKVDVIVLVTDEEENTQCNSFMFADLMKKYKEAINENVTLIVVSVSSRNGDEGFRESLASNKIDYKVVQIDESRPDLTKFDSLLGQIGLAASCVETNSSREEALLLENSTQNSTLEDDFVVV